jgi:hypothetical protein
MIVAVSTLDRLKSAPTERSIPAVMMTNVMPTAMIPVSDTARTMLAMLSGARKRMWPCRRGEKMMPPIATRMRPITLWKRTAIANRSMRRHAAGGAAEEARAEAASFMRGILARFGYGQDFMLIGAAGKFGDRAAAPQHHDPIAQAQ